MAGSMESELAEIRSMGRMETLAFYDEVLKAGDKEIIRYLCRNDRFFLLGCIMEREDVLSRDWCFERCREVEASPDGWLDLWSRFHYKSTIITLAGAVQEVLKDPETTIGILSYNRSIAGKFVDQIRREFERPGLVKLFPDILFDKPPRLNWSVQGGLLVKRRGNAKEPTVSGSGLVDGQPTGMHYRLRIYDDVVTRESTTTPEQIAKTTEAWELSLALGTEDGGREWYAGTRYHPNDTYSEIMRRGVVKERRRICVDSEGRPTMMMEETLAELQKKMGSSTWSAQMLQQPTGTGEVLFREEWLNTYEKMPSIPMNIYILADTAQKQRKTSDYTVFWVLGLGADRRTYVLDGVRDRLTQSQRGERLFSLVEKWIPRTVFYEENAAPDDKEYFTRLMSERGHFDLRTFRQTPADGSKAMRIETLEPEFREGMIWLPNRLMYRKIDGTWSDLSHDFAAEEFLVYPVATHDDMLDCLASKNHASVRPRLEYPAFRHAPRGEQEDFRIRGRGKTAGDGLFGR